MSLDPSGSYRASDILAAGSADMIRVAEIIAIGLAIQRDFDLCRTLRLHAGCPPDLPLLLKFSHLPAGMEIKPTGRPFPVRHHDAAVVGELEAIMMDFPDVRRRLEGACAGTRRTAQELLFPLVRPAGLPSRSEFEAVYEWSPLIDTAAYGVAATALSYLDESRELVRTGAAPAHVRNGPLSRYYELSHAMAHFTLISSNPTAGPWLAEMAGSFVWSRWTPTFPLARERTVWLAAAAARSAAAFGPAVIDRYLRILVNARHAFNIFDALFGLAAIALSHKDVLGSVEKAISAEAAPSVERCAEGAAHAATAFRSALNVLRKSQSDRGTDHVVLDRLGWSRDGGGDGLASRQAFRLDPSETGRNGLMLGFEALPTIVKVRPAQHYPRSKARVSRLVLRSDEMTEVMLRAWAPNPSAPAQMLH